MKNRLFLVTTGLFSSLFFSQFASADVLSLTCKLDEQPDASHTSTVRIDYTKQKVTIKAEGVAAQQFKCNSPITKEGPLRCEMNLFDMGFIKMDLAFIQNNEGVFWMEGYLWEMADEDSDEVNITTRSSCVVDK